MSRTRKSLAVLTTSALLAGPAVLLTAGPASAGIEREKEFAHSGAWVDWSVEKEGKWFDVDVDIDDAAPGSKWRVALRRDGKLISRKTYTADAEGEVEFSKYVKNSKGKDRFKLSIRNLSNQTKKSSKITMR